MSFERGSDWSKWQKPGDAAKAKAAGISTLVARACYGNSKDTYFDALSGDVRNAGILLGLYGFATWHYYAANGGSIDSARAMMHQQIARLTDLAAAKRPESWVALDMECEQGHEVGLSKSALTLLVNEACERIRAAGFSPAVYCSVSWLGSRLDPKGINAPLWPAYYNKYGKARTFFGETGDLPTAGTYGKIMQENKQRIIAWQFTSEAPGAQFGAGSKTVDLDFIYAQPEQAPQPETKPVDDAAGKLLTIKPGSWCIRREPNASAAVVGYAYGGSTHVVQKESNGWFNIGAGWVGPCAAAGLKDPKKYANTYFVETTKAMTAGDLATICGKLDELHIPYKTKIAE